MVRPSTAAWIDPLTPQERQGRDFYQYGADGHADHVRVSLGSQGGLPPTLFGARGVAATVDRERKRGCESSTHATGAQAGAGRCQCRRARPGYTDEGLANAITFKALMRPTMRYTRVCRGIS